jgi:uncharacterized protein (UPF0303 family)
VADEITLADLASEEGELRFATFTHDDAWALGLALVDAARRQQAPGVIDISRNGHQLVHAALPRDRARQRHLEPTQDPGGEPFRS